MASSAIGSFLRDATITTYVTVVASAVSATPRIGIPLQPAAFPALTSSHTGRLVLWWIRLLQLVH